MQIRIDGLQQARDRLGRTSDRLDPDRVADLAAGGVHRFLVSFFSAKPGRSFWKRMAAAVTSRIAGTGVRQVGVQGPMGAILQHKVKGGTIRPRQAANLAIPVTDQARRTGSPRAFPGLKPLFGRHGVYGLGLDGQIQYVFAKQVVQQPDPSAMPPDHEISASAEEAVRQGLKENG